MWGDTRTLGVIAVLVSGVVVGAVFGGSSSGTVASIESDLEVADEFESPLATIQVHVAGWVTSPGVVSISDGAIAAEAIDAAGGLRVGARSDLVNLAASLQDGDQLIVPGPDETGSGSVDDGLVGINSATEAELTQLPGVGPVLAARIVEYRETNGPYDEIESLLDVPGIGEAKLASMRDHLKLR